MAAAAPAVVTSRKQIPGRIAVARSVSAPLVPVALAYAVGIVIGRYRWNPAAWWMFAAPALLAAACFFCARNRRRVTQSLVLVTFALIGAVSLQLAEEASNPWAGNPQFAQVTSGEEGIITAHVIRSGIFMPGSLPRESVDLETESITLAGAAALPLRFGLRLSVYPAGRSSPENEAAQEAETGVRSAAHGPPMLRYGQRIQFPARLRQPRNFLDPGAFDYREFLAQQSIAALGSTGSDRIAFLPGFFGARLEFLRDRLRASLLNRIQRLWPGQSGALLSAILLGDRTGVDRETVLDYQRTGAYHILVVAGLKVGILAWVLLWLFGLLHSPEWLATPVAIAGMAAYAWLTDANPPAVRAVIMISAYLVARAFYRERNPLNAIAAAALALFFWQPQALWQASFQLTFVSMLAIAGIALPIMERTSSRLRRALRQFDSVGYDFALPPRLAQLRLDLRMLAGRLALFLGKQASRWMLVAGLRLCAAAYDVVLLSAILQMALALPMAFYFHRAVTLGLPANMLVVPLHALLLPVAALGVAASYVSFAAAAIPAWIASLLLLSTNRVVEALARWRIGNFFPGDLRTATPGAVMIGFTTAAFVFCLWAARRRRAASATGLAWLLAAAILVALPPRPRMTPGRLEISVLDVGQGDSLLVITPEGRTLLVDAGGELGRPGGTRFDMGEDVVSPALWARGITRLDAVALTHAHADHIGGMPAVLANFHPSELWIGPEPNIPPMLNLLRQARAQRMAIIPRADGDQFDFGGAHFRVLAPPRDWRVDAAKAQNNDSLVMLASFGRTSALLEGDAEKRVEREMVEEDPAPPGMPDPLKVNLLKVGHHGSNSSTTPELLAATQPKFAVISAGFRNPFHHPRAEVLERLEAAGARTFRTDTMGATSFFLDGKRVTAASFAQ